MNKRRGQTGAKPVPAKAADMGVSAMKAISEVRSLRRGIKLKGISVESLIKGGRR